MLNRTDSLKRFYHLCREHQLRITPQRVEIFQSLLTSPDHPTADGVYQRVRKKMPNISYDTVNRTLLSFSEAGLIKVVESRSSAKRFDPDVDLHHHFQCIRCNRIIDFYHAGYDHLDVPTHLPKGLLVLEKKVVLEGICEKCGR